MQVFAPYEPNLKKIKRRQAMRFGMPVLVFSLLMALLVAAVYYAQQDERDQNQAKLIADNEKNKSAPAKGRKHQHNGH